MRVAEKVAKLAEHKDVVITSDLGGNGTLPSVCSKCDGKLDFVRVADETVLQCRKCREIVALD